MNKLFKSVSIFIALVFLLILVGWGAIAFLGYKSYQNRYEIRDFVTSQDKRPNLK